jgi:hypothetical protein
MKKLTGLALGLMLLVPSLAFSDSFSLRIGYFMPHALSDTYLASHPDSLWAIELDQMSFAKNKFRGTTFGVGYEYFVGKYLSLAVSVDSYSKQTPGYYVDYGQFELTEGFFAFPYEFYDADIIEHAFRVHSTPLQLSLKFTPLGRKTRIIPFFGGGAGLYLWGVRIYGETIDFSDPWVYTDPDLGDIDIYPVVFTNGKESGTAFGWHAFAGFQIPIGFRATLDAEVRYHSAKAKFEEWFQGFDDFDLGGLALTLGFNYWF